MVYLQQSGIPSLGGRGEKSSLMKKGSLLDKWIVRKHEKAKEFYHVQIKK